MTLELKHLSPYLAYGLQLSVESIWPRFICPLVVANYSADLRNGINPLEVIQRGAKPILRPLSDLTKEIEHNGERFVPSVKIGIHVSRNHVKEMPKEFSLEIQGDVKYRIKGFYNYTYLKYSETQKLLEWHFDLFGLIENGLAVDINTLPKKSTDD